MLGTASLLDITNNSCTSTFDINVQRSRSTISLRKL